MKRIALRGTAFERHIDLGYLEALCDAYTRYFHYYDDSPLLIVNAAEINLIESDADYRLLLDTLGNVTSGRHYFNPVPHALQGGVS